MTVRTTLVALALLISCSVCHGADGRWINFAEDGQLKYYLDKKSIVSLPDNVYLFWIKSVAKDREYFQREYNLNNLSYILTSYELDCAVSSYRNRGSMMFDKNRKELNKTIPPSGEALLEPVPPESMLELAQGEICVKDEDGVAEESEIEEPATGISPAPVLPAARVSPRSPAVPARPAVPSAPAAPVPPASQGGAAIPSGPAEAPAEEAAPTEPSARPESVFPIGPAIPIEPAVPDSPATPPEPPSMQ